MTYGTGTTPGKQTVDDVAGMVSLSGKKQAAIDYKPRGPIVAPPAAAALPTPGSEMVATGPDWPRDPDALNAARKAAAGTALRSAPIPASGCPKTRRVARSSRTTTTTTPTRTAYAGKHQRRGAEEDVRDRQRQPAQSTPTATRSARP